MKRLFLALLLTVVIFTGLHGTGLAADKGPVTKEDVKEQIGKAYDTTKEYTMEQKQDYQKQLESQFADLSKRIDELKENLGHATQEAKTKLEGTVSDLQRKREEVGKKLPDLRFCYITGVGRCEARG